MKIINANLFIDGKFVQGGIEFDEKITAVGNLVADNSDFINAKALYLIPGLIDIHSHGAAGQDVSDGNSCDLKKLGEYYAKKGVTSWCPTTMSLDEEKIIESVKHIASYEPGENSAKIAGIHLEGPFLSHEKCGAQNTEFLKNPDFVSFKRIFDASEENIALVSVAPELDGATDFISKVSKYTNVSLAHTTADYDTSMRAFEVGANHVTHLFNAMPSLHHRMPGVIAAAFDSGAYVELICDGFHIHPAVIRLCFKLFGDKICLISDSIRCSGLNDGEYDLGGLAVSLKDGKICLKGTNTIAGSAVNLLDCIRRCVSFGIPLEKAVISATEVPAKAIGKFNEIGSLEVGKYADFVLLDENLNVNAVYISGKKAN